MKTILKICMKTIAEDLGYAYGYSSVYATFGKACGDKVAELEIKSKLEEGIKAEKDKKKKGK
tara:strand:- start:15 stop:200 length:186 start_codon:yes stop_codon:yes gene_type:complete